ncbi:FHA domain-containing protein [Marinitoga litoralis]|uniref:FHA domain-containing protein n=1 Tax=Marinitoga litoralis TaxID=570855 RepID=UPI001960BAAA|nr:FHA domain-containing protein [Marinitoga litoralis]MBM7560022.1 hypothetical protein [Marinitoga litoralis]
MKICLNCLKEYDDDFQDEFCECGGFIKEQTGKKIEKEMDEFLSVLNVIHTDNDFESIDTSELINEENNENDSFNVSINESINSSDDVDLENSEGILLKVYSSKKELIEKRFLYDEILIGRKNPETDIDLENFDLEKEISKRHVKILRENNEYYLLRLTKKTPIYLNQNIVKVGEKVKLNDSDKIIISKKIGIQVSFNQL